ncbi:MAG: 1-(5-phosphoribosyl)-5-[(5-phosphoribosylamino)methylideneamino]imidazole-4-carboxamide isomerase [Deltaproteobacteria bacterium]|nr:1-(5-phosphoribosyl)-5-[(5-phosphoribosylamino)methylideneamino]imidazole-4-carboxamide isomerase [Deltaproteobacteria bacterium]
MIIIPAIDIKDGRVVRLTQGRMDEETVYSESPVDVARKWKAAGAEIIHLVDLDGAMAGNAKNFGVMRSIIEEVDIPIQIGGGIRAGDTADKYLSFESVKRIIIGTAAFEDEKFVKHLFEKYPGRVAVGIDAKDGFVAIKGWITVTDMSAIELAIKVEKLGAAYIIYTDISRDGMLTGPNVKATKELAAAVSIPVIASGGISSIKDIESYKGTPVEGIIVGKALYAGKVDLKEAIETVKGF